MGIFSVCKREKNIIEYLREFQGYFSKGFHTSMKQYFHANMHTDLTGEKKNDNLIDDMKLFFMYLD